MNSSRAEPRYWPLGQLIVARLREFYREPEAIFWVYGFPIVMVVLLGIAFRNKPVESVKLDIVDNSLAKEARNALVKDEADKQRFDVETNDESTANMRLRTGKIDLILVATPNTTDSSSASGNKSAATPHYEFAFDPSRPESVLARNTVNDALQRAAGRTDPAHVSDHPINEPGSRYIDFLVPGLLGMGLMGGGLWGVGFVTVDMRIRKLLKRFLATPMKKSHFLCGIMISRLVFMVPEVLILLVFSWLVFGVVIQGSLFAVIVLILLGAGTFAGIGLLVASRARTLETVSGLMNLVMLPMWVLSGIFLQFRAVSRGSAAGNSRTAADAADLRAAEGHARGGLARRDRHATRHPRRMGDRDIHSCPEVVPLVVTRRYFGQC